MRTTDYFAGAIVVRHLRDNIRQNALSARLPGLCPWAAISTGTFLASFSEIVQAMLAGYKKGPDFMSGIHIAATRHGQPTSQNED
jgi:hypothetical protein